jgi:glycosyltransferase involved in cell wall biosynthesis
MADQVFILSPLEQSGVTALGVPPERQSVVTNGVEASLAEPVKLDVREALARRLRWRSDATNLLFAGNLTFNKGIDILLTALKRTSESVRLVIAGALRSHDQPGRLLRAAGLPEDDRRIVFTDHVTDEELRALYQLSDVFVFPSRADTLPLVVLEAMISSLPVIASDVGGIPFQVTAETGLIFPSEDATALAAAIDELARNPARRRELGATGRTRALTHFSWERSAGEAVRAYSEILTASQ